MAAFGRVARRELAGALKRVRRAKGVSQRDLAVSLNFGSHSSIGDFETGRRIPSAEVVDAYERYFELGDSSLRRLRERALAEEADEGEDDRSEQQGGNSTGTLSISGILLQRTDAEPYGAQPIPNGDPPISDTPTTNTVPQRNEASQVGSSVSKTPLPVPIRLRGGRRPWRAVLVTAAVTITTSVAVTVAVWPDDTPSARVLDGVDPSAHGCRGVSLDTAPITLPVAVTLNGRTLQPGTVLGTVSLRYSATCGGAWARFDPAPGLWDTTPTAGAVTLTERRLQDGTWSSFHLPHIDETYGDLLLTGIGCVQAAANVEFAGQRVAADGQTRCLPDMAPSVGK